MIETDIKHKWSEGFWARFLAEYWERHPCLLPEPRQDGFISLDELFEIVLASRGTRRLPSDRFWVARTPSPSRQEHFAQVSLDLIGPQPSDLNLAGFFARMQGRRFGINLHRLERWRPMLKARMGDLISRLDRVPGAPPVRRWDLDSFMGTYHMTPFGVHRDHASVFSFCLKGERTYLTWPSDYPWPADNLFVPDLALLQKHLHAAERFQIRAGEGFYWPSNRWHVVCSDGQPSVVVQLSAYFSEQDL